DWHADLETTSRLVGKARALALGEVDGSPVVAIAIDHRVVLWDPRHGASDEAAVIDLGDHRATGVALAAMGGRAVVVTTADYDGVTELWDAKTGERMAGANVGLGHTLAVGRLDDRLVIAGAGTTGDARILDAGTLAPIEPCAYLRPREVRAFAVHEGRLVGLVRHVDDRDGTVSIQVVDAADGTELWRSVALDAVGGVALDALGSQDVVAGGDIGPALLVVAAHDTIVHWLTPGNQHLEESGHHARMRAIAVGQVDGRAVVASAPDYDDTTLVELHQVEQEVTSEGVALYRGRVGGGTWSSVQDDLDEELRALFPEYDRPPRTLDLDRPREWPWTAFARGVLDQRPVVVTGSLDGAAWVWDVSGGSPTPIAGPFARVSQRVLDLGRYVFGSKPATPRATSLALGRHPDLGAVLAVVCDGRVRLYTVPAGEPVACAADGATVIAAVDLGRIVGRDVLVTGSKGGVLGLWGLAPPERLAVLTIDSPITDVAVEASGRVVLRIGERRRFAMEFEQP
ncbi:MAG TPA: WD40 repeat domain-containing protein, partial [Euzebya sp.]|nr:WD40 repeat domain-containing protein [Euzebya sp.]